MRFVVFLLVIAVFVAGCGSTTPRAVTDIDEIVGTWKSVPPALTIRVKPDGIVQSGVSITRIEENAASGNKTWESIFSFEAGHLNIANFIDCHDSVGLYDVQLLPNGNMQFTVVDDDCIIRVSAFMGQRVEPKRDVLWIMVD